MIGLDLIGLILISFSRASEVCIRYFFGERKNTIAYAAYYINAFVSVFFFHLVLLYFVNVKTTDQILFLKTS